jgi:hypothetical protein
MPASTVTTPGRERRAIAASTGDGIVLWMARRVVFDPRNRCECGASRKVVAERPIVAGRDLPQWVVISETCPAGC